MDDYGIEHTDTKASLLVGLNPNANRISISSRQTEIGYFDGSPIIHQQIAGLQIPVKDPILMTMFYGGQELKHQGLDLGLKERRRHHSQQGFEIVFDEIHDHKDSFLPHFNVVWKFNRQLKVGRTDRFRDYTNS